MKTHSMQTQIKQLTDKSSDLKGQPLKTSLRVMMGGQQCSATAKMKSNGSSSADTAAGSPNPITNVAQAGRYDVPPDWKKDVPKAAKQGDDNFTCPKTTN
jgi:hypothetical protein